MLVLKISGHQLDDPAFINELGRTLQQIDEPMIIVHGGGKEIKALQHRLGIEPHYIDGLRVTDAESLALVTQVLAGSVNKRLVATLIALGVDAFGLSGIDRRAVTAEKMSHPDGDLGFVGQVVEVRKEVFIHLLTDGALPVLSPVCYGAGGGAFNVNADDVSTAVAVAVQADALVYVSNTPGVFKDGQLLPRLSSTDVADLIAERVISDGMIPKTNSALAALRGGVSAVRITDLAGLQQNSGTTIVL